LIEGCKHSLEVSIPAAEVEAETRRVVSNVQKRAKLPGFRPGKATEALIRRQFAGDIRQQVLESLIPKFLQKRLEEENLHVVGTPDIADVHFHAGEPLRFTAEFEVSPEFELKEYKGLTVPYREPVVTGEDVDQRLEELRDGKAEYVNIDPRPLADGDYAVVSLESAAEVDGDPIRQDETVLHIGGAETVAAFSENLRGLEPGEHKDFEVTYPEDHGQTKLAGKTVAFHAVVKGLRRKDLPELNDEFAQDLGDFRTLEELREAVHKGLYAQREYEAQQEAKNALVDALVEQHDFPVPNVFIERQARNRMEQSLRVMQAEGIDPRSVKVDWDKVMESQRGKAVREVKASLLLTKIAEREAVNATRDEVDREVERIAKQRREPVAAAQMRMEKDGSLGRIASHIQTDKTLTFLFEHARKTDG
jgi:trigger factor